MTSRPAFLYSFSFAPDYLSRTIFSSGRDYVNYLYRVVERFGILDKIQLNADISSIEWIEHDMEWEIRFRDCSRKSRDTPDKEDFLTNEPLQAIRAKVVINAMGILTEPNEWPPDVRGRETFLGEVIHSAQWPADVDFENKHVVLVGSGCSATQIAPALLKSNIKTLLHVIRSPPWVVPRIEEPGGKDLYAQWAPRIYGAMPVLGSIIRILLCWLSELLWFLSFKQPSILRAQAECSSLAHMRKLAPKEYHDILKPSYSLGCKRRVFDNEWLRGMNDPRFTLTNKRLVSVKGREVILQSRQSDKDSHESSTQEYPADVVVLATGFKADRFFNHVSMIGRRGISIHGLWLTRGSPHAYMGTSVDGFPNLFLIMGPNTFVGHTSVMLSIENSIEYTLRLIKPILFDNVETMEPTSLAVRTWLEDVRKDMKRTIFDNCHSWYNGNGDENSIMYPYVVFTSTFNIRY